MKLVVFDCDGVLVDSEAIVVEIESQLLTEAGFPLTPTEIAETCVGLSYDSMMTMLEAQFGKPVPAELNDRIQREALAAFPERLNAIGGIDALLASSDLNRCVASSSNLDRINLSLDITGLAQYFEPRSIFSAQMVTHGKPSPDLFLYAADQMGASQADCLVVEDSPHGVTAAVAANMRVVGFTAGGHATPQLADRLRTAGAHAVVATAGELAEHINEL